MKAIILAAGRGSRMNELTNDAPKCLMTLKGRSLIEWQISSLTQAGVKDIAIVSGYKRSLLSKFNLFEFINYKWKETNMVYSLCCAKDWLQADPCIISYSDIFYDKNVVSLLMDYSGPLAITYDKNWLSLWEKRFDDPLSDAESFRIDSDGYLLEIGKKSTNTNDIQGQYMGLLKFTPSGWAGFMQTLTKMNSEELEKTDMTSVLQKVVEERKTKIKCLPIHGGWGEIDLISDLKLLRDTII